MPDMWNSGPHTMSAAEYWRVVKMGEGRRPLTASSDSASLHGVLSCASSKCLAHTLYSNRGHIGHCRKQVVRMSYKWGTSGHTKCNSMSPTHLLLAFLLSYASDKFFVQKCAGFQRALHVPMHFAALYETALGWSDCRVQQWSIECVPDPSEAEWLPELGRACWWGPSATMPHQTLKYPTIPHHQTPSTVPLLLARLPYYATPLRD